MITLYQPRPMFGLPNASPYCLKLEAFLRWQHIPFTIEHALPFQGPFKKVPFVKYQGETLGDSSHIIATLLKDRGIRYSDELNLEIGHAFARLVEEHLYWTMVYFRWQDDQAWPTLRAAFFGAIPFFVRPFIVASARKQATRALAGQGIGRLPVPMIIARAEADLCALNKRLQQHRYICGAQLTHYDLAIWAVLSQLVDCELQVQTTNLAKSYSHLTSYVADISAQLAPVWQTPDETGIAHQFARQ